MTSSRSQLCKLSAMVTKFWYDLSNGTLCWCTTFQIGVVCGGSCDISLKYITFLIGLSHTIMSNFSGFLQIKLKCGMGFNTRSLIMNLELN